jgi:hypothetical protein
MKKPARASLNTVAPTAEQLDIAARRFHLKSGVRAGKARTGRGHGLGKGGGVTNVVAP